jgi:hypothetical protein
MANLTFPSNPTNGQKVTVNDKVFVYNSTTGRWTATRLQVLGNLTDDFTIDAPTLGVSLSTVALDTVGANVYITYTVDQDVKASLTTSGLENTTATLYQTNNTIVVTAGATEFANGQISLVVSNGRSTDTEVINVSAVYIDFETMSIGTATNDGFFAGIIDTTQGNIIAADDYQTGARYALIVSPKEYEGGQYQNPAPGLITGALRWDALGRSGQSGSFTRWDGLSSTENILAKNDTQYEVFEFIRTLRTAYPVPDDGGSDWYVPAMDELELLYRNFKATTEDNATGSVDRAFPGTAQDSGFNPSSDPTGTAYTTVNPAQTSLSSFQSGGSETIGINWCKSSTDPNHVFNDIGYVWFQHFTTSGVNGLQSIVGKNNTFGSVRPVRRILL